MGAIIVPPRWIVEPTDVSVERNRQVALHCQAQGVPTPVIVWKKTTGENDAALSAQKKRIKEMVNCLIALHLFIIIINRWNMLTLIHIHKYIQI